MREGYRFLMMDTIRKRHAFLVLRDRGVKKVTKPFILQAYDRKSDDAPCFGLTASKKIGNAVRRNRARRRMRALVRLHLAPKARRGYHYGLIARYDVADMPFDKLEAQFQAAIDVVHALYDGAPKGGDKKPAGRDSADKNAAGRARVKGAK